MCYHIAFEVKLESIEEVFPGLVIDHQLDVDFPTAAYINGFNHAPQQVMLRSRKDNKLHLALMMWGFVPNHVRNMEEAQKFWNGYKDENGKWKTGYVTLNAIGEEVLEKKMYRDAALNRRCVIFMSGFYEWKHVFPMGKKGQPLKTPVKRPYHIYLKDNPYPFIMVAGIWNPWKHEEINQETGEVQNLVTPTFALLTTKANEMMSYIHNSKNRMPTILTKELAEEWVKDDLSEQRINEIATHQYANEKMGAFSIANDFQKIVNPKEKYEYEDARAEFC